MSSAILFEIGIITFAANNGKIEKGNRIFNYSDRRIIPIIFPCCELFILGIDNSSLQMRLTHFVNNKFLIITFLFFFFPLLFVVSQEKENKEVLRLIAHNKIDKAEKKLRAVFLNDTTNKHFLLLEGMIKRKSGEYEAAEKYLKKSLLSDSTYAWAYCELGVLKIFYKKYPEALMLMDKAMELDQTNPHMYSNRGALLYMMNRNSEAITDFLVALRIDGELELTWYNLGLCYYAKSDYPNAEEAFNKACALHPGNAKVHYDRGRLRYDQAKYQEALHDFNAAKRSNSEADPWEYIDLREIYKYRIKCYNQLGKTKRAERERLRLLQLSNP